MARPGTVRSASQALELRGPSRGAQLGRQRRGGRLPCLGPRGRVTAARGRTEGRAAGPHGAGAGDPDGLVPGLGGGLFRSRGAGAMPRRPQVCRSPRPVRQPAARQVHEAAPSAGLRRRSDAKPLTQRGEGELPSGTTARLREERAARPHHVAPRAGPHAAAPGALCSLETPGAGRPQGVPAPCRGLGETRRTGRQPPQTPRQPPPPRPRARCARTRGERGQPPGAGAECGEGATWLEAAGPSSHSAPIRKS